MMNVQFLSYNINILKRFLCSYLIPVGKSILKFELLLKFIKSKKKRWIHRIFVDKQTLEEHSHLKN